MLFCQSIDVVITNDTFYWFLLSKSPLSQSEALLDKSRLLLECAIHVFNSVSLCPPLFAIGGDIVKDSKMYAYNQFRFVRPNFKVSIVYMIKEGHLFSNVLHKN